MASDQSKKTQLERQTHVIELTSGVQTDQFAESVPILDSNNTEVLPGKSGMFNRRGHVRWTKYAPKTDPVGRIALVVDSQPPNLSDGTWLISAVDTSVPTNPIVYLQPFKPRTNLSNDTLVSQVYFSQSIYYEDYGNEVVLTINRIGALDRTFTVDWATEDGEAVAGEDYAAATGTITFESGDRAKTLTVQSLGTIYESDKDFVVKITSVSVGGMATMPDKATVVLEGTSSQLYPVASRVVSVPASPGRIGDPGISGPDFAMTRTIYTPLWCVDLSQTPSKRIALYVVKHDLNYSDWNRPDNTWYYNIGIAGTGMVAPVGINEVAFPMSTHGSVETRIMHGKKISTVDLRSGAPSFSTDPWTSVAGTTICANGPDLDAPKYLPDSEHRKGVGAVAVRDPDSEAVYLVGRNGIYSSTGWVPIQYVADQLTGWNLSFYVENVGNPSGVSTEVFWAGSDCFWQIRVVSPSVGPIRAVLCLINAKTGVLAKYIDLPGTGYLSTHLVLMDDGTPMLFKDEGQWVLNGSDVWVELSTTRFLREKSFIHNVGDNEVIYIPYGANRIARGKLHVDAPIEKLFDFGAYDVEWKLPGPTLLNPTRVFAFNLSVTPNTYAIFKTRDGTLLETGTFDDAYGAAAVAGSSGQLAYKSLAGETFDGAPGVVLAPIPVKKAYY